MKITGWAGRSTILTAACRWRRPIPARISRRQQAIEYGRLMGADAVRRQWHGSSALQWDVLRALERLPKPPRIGLLNPTARRA